MVTFSSMTLCNFFALSSTLLEAENSASSFPGKLCYFRVLCKSRALSVFFQGQHLSCGRSCRSTALGGEGYGHVFSFPTRLCSSTSPVTASTADDVVVHSSSSTVEPPNLSGVSGPTAFWGLAVVCLCRGQHWRLPLPRVLCVSPLSSMCPGNGL